MFGNFNYESPFKDAAPRVGSICKCKAGTLGVITHYDPHHTLWKGVQLWPLPGKPWQSKAPEVVVHAETLEGEMKDYDMFMQHCSEAYMWMTDGMVSKINTLPKAVIAVAEEKRQEAFQRWMEDELEDKAVISGKEASTLLFALEEHPCIIEGAEEIKAKLEEVAC